MFIVSRDHNKFTIIRIMSLFEILVEVPTEYYGCTTEITLILVM